MSSWIGSTRWKPGSPSFGGIFDVENREARLQKLEEAMAAAAAADEAQARGGPLGPLHEPLVSGASTSGCPVGLGRSVRSRPRPFA